MPAWLKTLHAKVEFNYFYNLCWSADGPQQNVQKQKQSRGGHLIIGSLGRRPAFHIFCRLVRHFVTKINDFLLHTRGFFFAIPSPMHVNVFFVEAAHTKFHKSFNGASNNIVCSFIFHRPSDQHTQS